MRDPTVDGARIQSFCSRSLSVVRSFSPPPASAAAVVKSHRVVFPRFYLLRRDWPFALPPTYVPFLCPIDIRKAHEAKASRGITGKHKAKMRRRWKDGNGISQLRDFARRAAPPALEGRKAMRRLLKGGDTACLGLSLGDGLGRRQNSPWPFNDLAFA